MRMSTSSIPIHNMNASSLVCLVDTKIYVYVCFSVKLDYTECLYFQISYLDVDDRLYPYSSGLSAQCTKNITGLLNLIKAFLLCLVGENGMEWVKIKENISDSMYILEIKLSEHKIIMMRFEKKLDIGKNWEFLLKLGVWPLVLGARNEIFEW